MSQKFWHKISLYWHICTAICWFAVLCAWWVQDVTGYGGRIQTLEEKQAMQEKKITRTDYNVQLIGRALKVDIIEDR